MNYRSVDGKFEPSYIPRFNADEPDKYIDARIKILREHFKIELTEDDISHLRGLNTEGEINAACRGIINKYWK